MFSILADLEALKKHEVKTKCQLPLEGMPQTCTESFISQTRRLIKEICPFGEKLAEL